MKFTEQDNRLIAEWLGICWHNWHINYGHEGGMLCSECWKLSGEVGINPDFSHRDGFWLIMEKGPKQDDWDKFLTDNDVVPWLDQNEDGSLDYSIKQDYIGPRLAEELLKFLKGREGK